MRIFNFILKRPAGTLMLCLALSAGGIWSVLNMRVDFLPDLTVPKLTVTAPYRGLPAEEIRRLITIPLEDSLSSVSGLKKINSISRDGLSLIELEFPWGTDTASAGIRTREAVDLAWQRLPSDSAKPQVLHADPGNLPVLTLGVFPAGGDLELARRLADRELRSMLQRIEGAGTVSVSGGIINEVLITAAPGRLSAAGFSLPELSRMLESTEADVPAGTITEGNTEYIVKTKSETRNLSELGNLYLSNTDGVSLKLKDIADIAIAPKKQCSFFLHAAGGNQDKRVSEGVLIEIRRQPGYSPKQAAENIRKSLVDIRQVFSRDLRIDITEDRSEVLSKSMKQLALSLVSGSCFAVLILFLFLRSRSKALIMLVSLPASLLWTVLLLNLFGRSLNLMSLSGLALSVGMVVDNSIIITERLARETEETAAVISSVAPSLLGSTLTTVIVFIPIFLIKGLAGALFGDLGLSVIFALSSSLIISVTSVPVLYRLSSHGGKSSALSSGSKLSFLIRKIIRFGLRHPAAALLAAAALCAAGVFSASRLKAEIAAPLNEGRLTCSLELPPGTETGYVKEVAASIAGLMAELPGIAEISARAGGEPDNPYYLSSATESARNIQFSIRLAEHAGKGAETALKEVLADKIQVAGGRFIIRRPGNILEELLGASSDSRWIISGDNPEAVRAAAVQTAALLNRAGGSAAFPVPSAEKTALTLTPDRDSIAALQADLPETAYHLRAAVHGLVPFRISLEGREIDVRLRFDETEYGCRSGIMNLEVPNSQNTNIRIGAVSSLTEDISVPCLLREDRKDIGMVQLQYENDYNVACLQNAGFEKTGISNLSRRKPELLLMLVLALVLLYLSLGIQFESFLIPLLLMLCLPAGASGISIALLLTGNSINLNSSLGVLLVAGVSVNSGILLYDESLSRYLRSGAAAAPAVYRGTIARLRPVLMTSLTTVTALLPLTFNPSGTSSQVSLAAAVIGGIICSTIMSLLLLPGILLLKLKTLEKSLKQSSEQYEFEAGRNNP